ncbi:molybdopterin synthase sulfur carrier subunit [Cyclobacterium lianum]|uniref:Molybdopterin synthase sulfur carrier subunit n=1 Tax=Cyclobacterium lianum TaxID=388280 RepID=A0A1M7L6U4_9BACT|nr:MoaD/ThiS family protein [Cyclobacterium lianum]SHM73604.1 molybdopterin synthase sulfur carrier subunit [Cyclobacterium lianum]
MDILLFGIAREIIGDQKLRLPGDHGIDTVMGLKTWLLNNYPQMGNLNSLAIAVDQEYAQDDLKIHEGQEIALIPPVSGG